MALAQEDKAEIQALIDLAMSSFPEMKNANVRYELDLRERTIRVEEELKHQRELMMEGFNRMEKHLEHFHLEMNQRFEQVDKRFEQNQLEMNTRFEQVQLEMNTRFEKVDKRFEQSQLEMHQRFEQTQLEMQRRFDQVDKRFEQMGKRLDRFMFWSLGLTISSAVFVVNFLK